MKTKMKRITALGLFVGAFLMQSFAYAEDSTQLYIGEGESVSNYTASEPISNIYMLGKTSLSNSDFSGITFSSDTFVVQANKKYADYSSVNPSATATIENVDFSSSIVNLSASDAEDTSSKVVFWFGNTSPDTYTTTKISDVDFSDMTVNITDNNYSMFMILYGSTLTDSDFSGLKYTATSSLDSEYTVAFWLSCSIVDNVDFRSMVIDITANGDGSPSIAISGNRTGIYTQISDVDFRGSTFNGDLMSLDDFYLSTGGHAAELNNVILGDGTIYSAGKFCWNYEDGQYYQINDSDGEYVLDDSGNKVVLDLATLNTGLSLSSTEDTLTIRENLEGSTTNVKLTVDSDISAGSVIFENTGVLEIKDEVSLTLDSNADVDFDVQTGSASVSGGSIESVDSSAFLNKTGEGSLALNTDLSNYTGTLSINEGSVSLDSSFSGRIENYSETLSTLSDISFYNITSSEYGTAIYNEGNLSLTGTISFIDNTSSATYGRGTIDNANGGNLSLTGTISFENNTSYNGGAIVNSGSNDVDSLIEIKGSSVVFEDNTATSNGGAVYNSSGTIKIENTAIVFEDNTATGNGGAIFNSGGTAVITIGDNADFYDNESGKYGGAVYNYNSSISIGANAEFNDNTATTLGGAIFNSGYYNVISEVLYTGYLTIGEGSSFYNNSSEYGGAIFIDKYTNVSIGANSKFTYNTSTSDGGAIVINTNTSNKITIGDNAYFAYNESGQYGGAIIVASSLSLNKATFDNNTAASAGGAIYQGTLSEDLTITNSSFSSNSASAGGAVGLFGGATISGTTFDSNYTSADDTYLDGGDGGAIFIGSEAVVEIDSVIFTNNTTKGTVGSGGAIAMRGYDNGDNSAASLDIIDSTFKNNSATVNGGAIENTFYNSEENKGYVSVVGTTFESNSATGLGGAIYNNGNPDKGGNVASIWLEDTTFTGNSASAGGAVYAGADSTVYFKATSDISSTGNSASSDENGGFLYMAENSKTTFDTVSGATMTIGNGLVNYDSIAGTGTITKSGIGTLTVNSSMKFYTGALNVDSGIMEVNNTLGASEITIDSGATLNMGITSNTITNGSIFSNEDGVSITNSGTLNLIASSSLSADDSVSVGSYTLSGNNIVAYGGTITDGTFTVSALQSYTLEKTTSLDVNENGRVSITDGSNELLSMAFSSSSESISLTVSDSADSLSEYLSDSSLTVEAYTFSVTGLDSDTDSVVLSFVLADSDYSVSDFTIYYKSDTGEWGEATEVSDITFEDGTLSFIVDSFSSYGYSVVPEPSTYALIFGVLSLGFVAYRRKRK